MSIYVDPLHSFNNDNNDTPRCFRNTSSCHLYGDNEEELHQFALSIGMKRSWFQKNRLLNHYDLVPSKRILAVKKGAIQQTRQEAVDKWKELRKND